MGLNPLTYLELEAYERKALNPLPAWEARLIMRLDRAVLAAINENAKNDETGAQTEVSINDKQGVRGLLSGIRDRLKHKRR